jgi:Uri superfamily endonuclease
MDLPEPITNEGGSYLLILRMDMPAGLIVGRLGTFVFPAGWYVYTGSAFGPGGLRARLRHHWNRSERAHWHIDALRSAAQPVSYLLAPGERGLECRWAQALFKLGGQLAAPGFGASDCHSGCPAHLIFFKETISLKRMREILANERLNRELLRQGDP